jgi:hypothetical protein
VTPGQHRRFCQHTALATRDGGPPACTRAPAGPVRLAEHVAPGPSSRLARSRPPWKRGNRGLVVLLPQGIVMGWLMLAAMIQIRL